MGNGFFDGSDVDDGVLDQFENLPDGDYVATVTNCEQRAGKVDPTVLMYSIEFDIVKGEHSGRKVFANFCYQHRNPKAVNIGKARMKKLCEAATGKISITKSEELYNKPVMIRLKTKPDKRTGEPSTNVTGISKLGATKAPSPTTTTNEPLQTRASIPPTGAASHGKLDLNEIPF